MNNPITTEPVLFVALVQAVLGVVIAFGVDLTDDQQKAVLGLAAVLVLVAVWVRSRVTPVKRRG